MLTKEECKEALEILKGHVSYETVDAIVCFKELIAEHFYNPPLSVEEVEQCCHEGIPVWDKEIEEYVQIHDVLKGGEKDALVTVVQFFFEDYHVYPYYKTRFYRKEVKDVD